MSQLSTDPSAKKITRLHKKIMESMNRSLNDAITIGKILTEQKKKLGHGKFLPWVSEQLPFTSRSASNYMKLYRKQHEIGESGVENLSSAYRLLTGPVESKKAKSETVSDLGDSPLDDSLVLRKGFCLLFEHRDDQLYIDPSNHEGYCFVTLILSDDQGGGFYQGTRRPILLEHVHAAIRSFGGSLVVELGDKSEIPCEPLSFNRWLFDSAEQSVLA